MKVTETIGLVGFVDAGNSFSSVYPDFSEGLKVGAGAGIRYFTPVGPLRLDVAVPLTRKRTTPASPSMSASARRSDFEKLRRFRRSERKISRNFAKSSRKSILRIISAT